MFWLQEPPKEPYENYAGHPVLGKSVLVNVIVGNSGNTGDVKTFLNQSQSAYQLTDKTIECIIVNTRYVDPPSVFNGNIRFGIQSNLIILYGYTITLVDTNNQYLVYNYPLINLISTSVLRVPNSQPEGRQPKTYKFFNCKIDPNKSYISTFDPTITPKEGSTISLTFYYR